MEVGNHEGIVDGCDKGSAEDSNDSMAEINGCYKGTESGIGVGRYRGRQSSRKAVIEEEHILKPPFDMPGRAYFQATFRHAGLMVGVGGFFATRNSCNYDSA